MSTIRRLGNNPLHTQIYNTLFRNNSTMVATIVVGAFFGDMVVDSIVNQFWSVSNRGVSFQRKSYSNALYFLSRIFEIFINLIIFFYFYLFLLIIFCFDKKNSDVGLKFCESDEQRDFHNNNNNLQFLDEGE